MTDDFNLDELEAGMRRAGVNEFVINRVMIEAIPLAGPRRHCRMIERIVADEAPSVKHRNRKPPTLHVRRRIR